jgi:ribokinase
MSPEHDLVVVGSANLDLAIAVRRPPRRGETVLGGDPVRGPGGKGLNQAVAAARLGLRTGFVGAVGSDEAGAELLEVLLREGVAAFVRTETVATGLAVVLSDERGDSTITVSPGANAYVDREAVEDAAEQLRTARAVLVQHEIPESGLRAAAELSGGLLVLNPAPGRPVATEVLVRVDLLVPNRHELAVLLGVAEPPVDGDAAIEMARSLRLPGTVVVTLGEDGAVVIDPDGTAHRVAAEQVEVVDTTAAGDTFCAALVHGVLGGADLVEAAQWASRVAAQTVGTRGAALSTPYLDQVSRGSHRRRARPSR